MFFAALTSASLIMPQFVHANRDLLMRLAASMALQAFQHREVSAGSTTTTVEPCHGALYSSIVRKMSGGARRRR